MWSIGFDRKKNLHVPYIMNSNKAMFNGEMVCVSLYSPVMLIIAIVTNMWTKNEIVYSVIILLYVYIDATMCLVYIR